MTIKQTLLLSVALLSIGPVLTFFLAKDNPKAFFDSFIIIGPDVRLALNLLLR